MFIVIRLLSVLPHYNTYVPPTPSPGGCYRPHNNNNKISAASLCIPLRLRCGLCYPCRPRLQKQNSALDGYRPQWPNLNPHTFHLRRAFFICCTWAAPPEDDDHAHERAAGAYTWVVSSHLWDSTCVFLCL